MCQGVEETVERSRTGPGSSQPPGLHAVPWSLSSLLSSSEEEVLGSSFLRDPGVCYCHEAGA